MGVSECERCSKCGSDLASAPELHSDPKPHRVISVPVKAMTDGGEITVGTLTTCVCCNRTKAEIEKRGEPMEPHIP